MSYAYCLRNNLSCQAERCALQYDVAVCLDYYYIYMCVCVDVAALNCHGYLIFNSKVEINSFSLWIWFEPHNRPASERSNWSVHSMVNARMPHQSWWKMANMWPMRAMKLVVDMFLLSLAIQKIYVYITSMNWQLSSFSVRSTLDHLYSIEHIEKTDISMWRFFNNRFYKGHCHF